MYRSIDKEREENALSWLAEVAPETLSQDARDGDWGARSRVLDLVVDARLRGARAAKCATFMGVHKTTLERWKSLRSEILDELNEHAIRMKALMARS